MDHFEFFQGRPNLSPHCNSKSRKFVDALLVFTVRKNLWNSGLELFGLAKENLRRSDSIGKGRRHGMLISIKDINVSPILKMKKSQAKSTKVRKVLVRNAVVPARSSQVAEHKKQVHFAGCEGEKKSDVEENDLSCPEFCTILKLADEIRKVKLKPVANTDKKKVQVFKSCNVNFEPDVKLFHDLVSVDKPNPEFQLKDKMSSYKSACKKDPEPDYKELLQYSLQPEYTFTKFYIPDISKPVPEFDGRSIYKLSQRWNKCDIH